MKIIPCDCPSSILKLENYNTYVGQINEHYTLRPGVFYLIQYFTCYYNDSFFNVDDIKHTNPIASYFLNINKETKIHDILFICGFCGYEYIARISTSIPSALFSLEPDFGIVLKIDFINESYFRYKFEGVYNEFIFKNKKI